MTSQAPQLDWDAPRLGQRLSGILQRARAQGGGLAVQGAAVRVVACTGSTNTDLLSLAREHPQATDEVQVLVAESQTAGRGRQGRAWQACPGASLTFSLALPMRPQPGWGALSLAVGHALAQALQPWDAHGPLDPADGRLMLKWPNDLWWLEDGPAGSHPHAQGRKVAGILIETLPLSHRGMRGMHDEARWVVVGVGVNIHADALPHEGLPAAGVVGTSHWRPDEPAPAIAHRVVPALLQALLAFEVEGFEALRTRVERRDLLVGQPVRLSSAPVAEGLCLGIEPDGALRVQGPHGPVRVVAGEVQVRPQGHGAC